MKIFRVVIDRNEETANEPGNRTTKIVRQELRFAAETIQHVWDGIEFVRRDNEVVIIAIIEEAPAITILWNNADLTDERETKK